MTTPTSCSALVPYRVNGAGAAGVDMDERLVQLPFGICLRVRQCPRSSGAWRHLTQGPRMPASDGATPPPQGASGSLASPQRARQAEQQAQADLSNVGMVVWQSALVLADWLLRRPPLGPGCWPGVCVLEVGAGTGVVGMALALAGARVVLSDLTHITPLTRANVLANCAAAARGLPRVADHTWGEPVAPLLQGLALVRGCSADHADAGGAPSAAAAGDGAAAPTAEAPAPAAAAEVSPAAAPVALGVSAVDRFDLVVAADVLYDPTGHEPLLQTLEAVAAPHALVALAHRLRGRGEEQFAAAAEARGWAVRGVPPAQLADDFQGGEYEVLLLARRG